MAAMPNFVCPKCRGELETEVEAYTCHACASTYPIVLGIPDFRVEPDPWIGIEDDRAKARHLVEQTAGLGFAATVAAYWAMTPGTAPTHARRFTDYVLAGERRASGWLDALAPLATQNTTSPSAADVPWLEIGCGSGDLLVAAASRGICVVGVDVAMRWLVLARKRAALSSDTTTLVCANGEHLPFADRVFPRVVTIGTLEHCRRAEAVLAESARVLQSNGVVEIRTTNRFTLLPEPHVAIWGVGFVPRRYADWYVRLFGGQGYRHHRPLSPRELARGLRRAGFSDVRVGPARLLAADYARLDRGGRLARPAYDWARSTRLVSAGLRWVAPLLEARGRAV